MSLFRQALLSHVWAAQCEFSQSSIYYNATIKNRSWKSSPADEGPFGINIKYPGHIVNNQVKAAPD